MARLGLYAMLATTLVVLGCGDETSNTNTATTGPGSGGAGGTAATGGNGPGSGGSGAMGGSGGAGGTPVPQNQFLYVANENDDNVSVYMIDDAGALTFVESEDVTGGPGPLAVTPDETRLYVAAVSGRAVSAFDIDQTTGALTAIGGAVSVTPAPVYISVDHTGSYLLLASYGGNVAQSYGFMGDGTLNGTPISSHTGPGIHTHSIVISPSNGFAFAANTNPTPETISQFVFNPADGMLTDNPVAATIDVSGVAPVGPRHLTFHPTLDILYAVNEHSDSVTVYAFNPTTGVLTEGATTSTLPGGVSSGSNTCADIHITPNGNALYASNRGDDSLAMFSVDAAGALTVLGHVDTETVPREFEVTRDGRFVYAAGQDSDTLAAYAVGSDGTLTPLSPATYAVGDRPKWVLAISVDQP
jgi:6-phosphogluconolactonase